MVHVFVVGNKKITFLLLGDYLGNYTKRCFFKLFLVTKVYYQKMY